MPASYTTCRHTCYDEGNNSVRLGASLGDPTSKYSTPVSALSNWRRSRAHCKRRYACHHAPLLTAYTHNTCSLPFPGLEKPSVSRMADRRGHCNSLISSRIRAQDPLESPHRACARNSDGLGRSSKGASRQPDGDLGDDEIWPRRNKYSSLLRLHSCAIAPTRSLVAASNCTPSRTGPTSFTSFAAYYRQRSRSTQVNCLARSRRRRHPTMPGSMRKEALPTPGDRRHTAADHGGASVSQQVCRARINKLVTGG